MATPVAFNFSASDTKDPDILAKRLNDYVGQANQVFATVPARQFVTVDFKTYDPMEATPWPVVQPRGITPIAVCIARVQNLDDVKSTLATAPWLDWTMMPNGMIKIISATGLEPLTRYRFTLEVVSAE